MAKVTNKMPRLYALPGGQAIAPGKTVEVEDWEKLKKHNHVKTLLDQKLLEAEEPAASEPIEGYAIRDNKNGWHVILKDGVEVTKNLRKEETEAFATMDDEDKEAFIAENKIES